MFTVSYCCNFYLPAITLFNMNLHNLFLKHLFDISELPDSVIVGDKSFIYVPVCVSSVRFIETEKISTEVSLEETSVKIL